MVWDEAKEERFPRGSRFLLKFMTGWMVKWGERKRGQAKSLVFEANLARRIEAFQAP